MIDEIKSVANQQIKVLHKTPGSEYWDAFLNRTQIDTELFFYDSELSIETKKVLFKKYMCIVNIETSSYCNRKCVYCPVSKYDRSEQHLMDDTLFSSLLNQLNAIDYESTISLNLYNEPLKDPLLFNRIEEIKTKCPKCFLKFSSNGDYLTKDLVEHLAAAGVSALFLTMQFSKDEKYTDELARKKIETFFSRLSIAHGAISCVSDVSLTCDVYYKGLRLLVMTNNWAKYGSDRGGTVTALSRKNRCEPCVRPFREMVIDYRGNVLMCCQIFPDATLYPPPPCTPPQTANQ